MLVIVALANKMARIVWALLAKGGIYTAPAAVVSSVRAQGAVGSVGGTTGKYGAAVDETGSESQFVAEQLERAS
jgi:hypothetical protein